MSFDDRIRQLRNLVDAMEIDVLIWGPGNGSGEHFEKRKKMRAALERAFPHAEVRFSEELNIGGAEDLGLPDQELWHLAACDLCVVLDTSKGPGEEIAYFSSSRAAFKLLILSDEKYRDSTSFPAALRRNKNQIFYTQEEYRECNVVERVVVRARQVALAKLLGLYGG